MASLSIIIILPSSLSSLKSQCAQTSHGHMGGSHILSLNKYFLDRTYFGLDFTQIFLLQNQVQTVRMKTVPLRASSLDLSDIQILEWGSLSFGERSAGSRHPVAAYDHPLCSTKCHKQCTLNIFSKLGPGRHSLVGSSGGYTYHRYTSHASPRACGARLGRIVQERPCAKKELVMKKPDSHEAFQDTFQKCV